MFQISNLFLLLLTPVEHGGYHNEANDLQVSVIKVVFSSDLLTLSSQQFKMGSAPSEIVLFFPLAMQSFGLLLHFSMDEAICNSGCFAL